MREGRATSESFPLAKLLDLVSLFRLLQVFAIDRQNCAFRASADRSTNKSQIGVFSSKQMIESERRGSMNHVLQHIIPLKKKYTGRIFCGLP